MAGTRVSSRSVWGLTALLLVSVLPAATLVWLGLRLLDQDRDLVAQRDFDRRQAAAPVLARALNEILADAERALDRSPLSSDVVRITATKSGVLVDPPGAAAWLPVVPLMPEADDRTFVDADAREAREPAAALSIYQAAASAADHAVRAGALMRIARAHRVAHRWDAALDAYRRLGELHDVTAIGTPADLQARKWSAEVLKSAGRHDAFAQVVTALEGDFTAGRWPADRATWDFISSELAQLTGHAIDVASDRRLVSDQAESVWRGRMAGAADARQTHRTIMADNRVATVLTSIGPEVTTALVCWPERVTTWLKSAEARMPATGAVVTVLSDTGQIISGPPVSGGAATVILAARDAGLPWTLALSSGDTSDLVADFAGRRRLLWIGLASILVLIAGGTFFAWRVMQREIAVSHVQTQFVAAVSHEFRTPLTALRHVTELLEERDDVPAERRREFYRTLGRNVDRLQRLVESLLDFSRMESGRKPYALREEDAGELVSHVVADFQRDIASHHVSVALPPESESDLRIRADAAALSTAVWNLLDNAVKYSPEQRDISVRVDRDSAGVSIAVRDHGMGIPPRERRAIFDRFIRGHQATALGIKGTGLGLALVSHIIDAHGGTIDVESEPGTGSTFTIVLPAMATSREEQMARDAPCQES